MPDSQSWNITPADRDILRTLAARVAEIAHSPASDARRQRWLSHNALRGGGPMILCESGGLRRSGELTFESQLACRQPWARDVETTLRWRIWDATEVGDDDAMAPFFDINWRVSASNYGVDTRHTSGSTPGHMGSYHIEPPLKNLAEDFHKLKPRTFTVDRAGTLAWQAHLNSIFGDILPVRIRGGFWWTMGLTIDAIHLIGLEELMMYMYDEPEGLHRLMAFLRDDHLAHARWLQREGLLTLNNESDYIGSGSRGHTAELPQAGHAPGGPARLRDLWVLSESQETVGVGPEQFAEFIFPYQLEVAREFGLCYYGCCEPVHNRWHIVRNLPNLRKASVSPWCDEAMMASALGRQIIYCRKPNPSLISTDTFDEDAIRRDLDTTLRAARGCHVELVMKDVHTVRRDLSRLGRWVKIAREAVAAAS